MSDYAVRDDGGVEHGAKAPVPKTSTHAAWGDAITVTGNEGPGRATPESEKDTAEGSLCVNVYHADKMGRGDSPEGGTAPDKPSTRIAPPSAEPPAPTQEPETRVPCDQPGCSGHFRCVDTEYGSLADGGSYDIYDCDICGRRKYVELPD